MAIKGIRLRALTATASSYLLRATGTGRRSAALERTEAIGVLRLTRVGPIARTAFTSIVVVGAWVGATVTAVGVSAQSQNKSEAHSIYSIHLIYFRRVIEETRRNFFIFARYKIKV